MRTQDFDSMSTKSHTPGPWNMDITDERWWITCAGRAYMEAPFLLWVAEVHSTEEDANLIASAPDMRTALEKVDAKCEALQRWILERNQSCDREETIPPEIDNELTEMRADIAKAKGAR